jgi:hypothetical protein
MSFGKLASTFALVSTISMVLLAHGCSREGECRMLCEEQEEADCFAAPIDAVDCERTCLHQLDQVTNADCLNDWDAYVLCVDELENICDWYVETCKTGEDCDDPKCDNELRELNECIAEYCQENPRNNECEQGIGGGTPPKQ